MGLGQEHEGHSKWSNKTSAVMGPVNRWITALALAMWCVVVPVGEQLIDHAPWRATVALLLVVTAAVFLGYVVAPRVAPKAVENIHWWHWSLLALPLLGAVALAYTLDPDIAGRSVILYLASFVLSATGPARSGWRDLPTKERLLFVAVTCGMVLLTVGSVWFHSVGTPVSGNLGPSAL